MSTFAKLRDECLRLQSYVTNGEDVSGMCLSKGSAVWTFIVIADYDVARQQFFNVEMFN